MVDAKRLFEKPSRSCQVRKTVNLLPHSSSTLLNSCNTIDIKAVDIDREAQKVSVTTDVDKDTVLQAIRTRIKVP